jgi:hypothetical protein
MRTFVPRARAICRYLVKPAAHGMDSRSHEEADMYPNSALSAGQLAIIAVVAMLSLAVWLTGVFVAAREPRQHSDHREPPRKAA